jgi:hypothetical protein
MDKKLTFSGGEPVIKFDDLDRNNEANRKALFAMMAAFGIDTNENFIISGCVATITPSTEVSVTAGHIFLNGEVLEVEAQTVANGGTNDLYKYTKVTTYDSNGTKTFNDAVVRETWQKNRGVVVAATAPILSTELNVKNTGDTDRLGIRSQGQVISRAIAIGTWDMNTTDTVSVGISSIYGEFTSANIVGIRAFIYSVSAGSLSAPLLSGFQNNGEVAGGIEKMESDTVKLNRVTAGYFDDVNYSGASNRGYIVVDFLAY